MTIDAKFKKKKHNYMLNLIHIKSGQIPGLLQLCSMQLFN